MACTDQEYFVGQGEILFRPLADNCGDPTNGWRKVGDANELTISTSQTFNEHFESQSGLRRKAARWLTETSSEFTLSIQNLSLDNLADLLLGEKSAAVAAGTVTNEVVEHAYEGRWVYVAYPGISAVTVKSNSGANTLVVNVDYELDTRNGGIKILSDTLVVNNTLTVTYTHVGTQGMVSALKNASGEFQIRFNGINMNAPNTPVIVELKRAQINAAENLSLIGTDVTSLTFTGALLTDSAGETFTVLKANTIA